jgi:5-methylcytosine-specific restriction protein A
MDKPLERMRLFWRSDFSDLLQKSIPEWYQAFSQDIKLESDRPEMRFQKLADSEYQIDFIRPAEINLDIESETTEETLARSEGAAKYSYSKRYERNPENLLKAIEMHGCKCCICGFDFELVYGERGKGFIEVHHTKPLSEVEGETVIDPATDLVPVCSNCHRMIHRRKMMF